MAYIHQLQSGRRPGLIRLRRGHHVGCGYILVLRWPSWRSVVNSVNFCSSPGAASKQR